METQTAFSNADVDTTDVPTTLSQSSTTSLTNTTSIKPHFIAAACILIIVSIVALVGNLFVIVAVSLSRRLQTPTNTFVVTLSCVDFLSALVLPFQAGALLGAANAYPPFFTVCEVAGAFTCVVNFWSFSLLVVIAFNRYLIITKPSRRQQMLFSERKIAAIIVIVLAVPIVMLVVFLGTDGVRFGLSNNLCGVAKGKIFNYLFGACTLTAMAAMAFFYVNIYLHVRNHVQNVQNRMGSMRGNVPAISTMSIRTRENNVNRRQLDEQITRNLFCVVFFFFLCIAPVTVTFFTIIPPILLVTFFVIMSLSYCVNPIIYAWRHPVFRKVFRCMISRRLANIDEPSPWLRKILTPKM